MDRIGSTRRRRRRAAQRCQRGENVLDVDVFFFSLLSASSTRQRRRKPRRRGHRLPFARKGRDALARRRRGRSPAGRALLWGEGLSSSSCCGLRCCRRSRCCSDDARLFFFRGRGKVLLLSQPQLGARRDQRHGRGGGRGGSCFFCVEVFHVVGGVFVFADGDCRGPRFRCCFGSYRRGGRSKSNRRSSGRNAVAATAVAALCRPSSLLPCPQQLPLPLPRSAPPRFPLPLSQSPRGGLRQRRRRALVLGGVGQQSVEVETRRTGRSSDGSGNRRRNERCAVRLRRLRRARSAPPPPTSAAEQSSSRSLARVLLRLFLLSL